MQSNNDKQYYTMVKKLLILIISVFVGCLSLEAKDMVTADRWTTITVYRPEGVESVQGSTVTSAKRIIDGQLYIVVDEDMFDFTGKKIQ